MQNSGASSDLLAQFKKVTGRAGETVKPGYDDNVAVAQLVEHAAQFRPVGAGTRLLLLEHASAVGRLQCGELQRQILVVGRDAGVADVLVRQGMSVDDIP